MSKFIKFNRKSGHSFVEIPLFGREGTRSVRVKNILYDKKSSFQEILIVETPDGDRVFFLDGVVQCSLRWSWVYDKMALIPMSSIDSELLVLGGGDGDIVRLANAINPDLNITLVELDSAVIDASSENFGPLPKNVDLVVGDALEFLRNYDGEGFHGIVSDLTDTPIGTKGKKQYERFYSEVVELCWGVLGWDGWISIQAGPPKVPKGRFDSNKFLRELLARKGFERITTTAHYVPIYFEDWSIVCGWKL
ncbi:MAG: hypothetical protein FJZ04_02010 [Candidatus Moranbacteria bacterium]|nr:hypothetical protein [Candidatus Moranbacteria bacterium]